MYTTVVPTSHELLRMELLSEVGELAEQLHQATERCKQAAAQASVQLRKEAAANAAAIHADILAEATRQADVLRTRVFASLAESVDNAVRRREGELQAAIRQLVHDAVREEVRETFRKMLL